MRKMKTTYLVLIYTLIGMFCYAQNEADEVLFTVDNEPIMASEFIRVYSKNLDLVKDEKQKDIDQYLNLFVNYKLKIKEAHALGFHEKPKYVREFNSYKKQLAKNYMTDHEVTEALVKEAYDRVSSDVNVSHVLIRLPEFARDTAAVYKRMLKLRDRLQSEDFETLKADIHDGQQVIAEDLGYFSGFKMVYAFETEAYNTPVGEVSKPFRTRFGYHVLKVFDKRESRGEVTVGHIMVRRQQKDSLINAEQRIQEIYKMIKSPEDFESLAKQFSEDPSSAKNGGRLPSFKSGQLSSTEFENVAFDMVNENEITKPFKTEHGWHIVKLYEKKSVGTYEQLKPELTQKVKRDSRSKVISDVFIAKLKARYDISETVDVSYFVSILNDNYFERTWEIPADLPKERLFIQIGDQNYTYNQFAEYLKNGQRKIREKLEFETIVNQQAKSFIDAKILQYHEANLEQVSEDYANVIAEYRDGLLLFDLMEDKIWNAVKEDTTALMAYYEKNKMKYQWPERIDAIIVSGANKEHILAAEKALQKGADADVLKTQLNTEDSQNIIVTSGKFGKDHQVIPDNFNFKNGITPVYSHNNAFHVAKVNEVLPASQKSFEDSKGNVISDYQLEYEAKWIESLRAKYTIKVNNDVLENIKNQMSN